MSTRKASKQAWKKINRLSGYALKNNQCNNMHFSADEFNSYFANISNDHSYVEPKITYCGKWMLTDSDYLSVYDVYYD